MDEDSGIPITTDFRLFARKKNENNEGVRDKSNQGVVKQMYCKDGTIVLASHDDKHLRVWNVQTQQCMKEIPLDINCSLMELRIGFLYVVLGSTLKAWDIQSQRFIQNFQGHNGTIYRFIVNGGALYTVSADHTARAWDIKSGSSLIIYEGHTDSVTSLDIYEGILFTASSDKTIKSWEALKISELAYSNFDLRKKNCLFTFTGHTKLIFGIKIHLGILYSASIDETIRTWDISTGKQIQSYSLSSLPAFRVDFRVMSDDNTFVYSSENFNIAMWNMKTGKMGTTFIGHRAEIRSLKCKFDYLFSASADRTMRKWSMKDGSCLQVFRGPSSPLTSMVILEDLILSSSEDGNISIWDVKTSGPDTKDRKKKEKVKDEIERLKELGLSQQFVSNPVKEKVPIVNVTAEKPLTEQEKKELLKEAKKVKQMEEKKKEVKKVVEQTKSSPKQANPNAIKGQYVGWYVGSMDRITAEAILSNCGYNSFLIRIGSVQGCYVISKYNILTKAYYHVLVANKNSTYLIQDSVDTTPYSSLAELVDKSPEIGNYKAAFSEEDDEDEEMGRNYVDWGRPGPTVQAPVQSTPNVATSLLQSRPASHSGSQSMLVAPQLNKSVAMYNGQAPTRNGSGSPQPTTSSPVVQVPPSQKTVKSSSGPEIPAKPKSDSEIFHELCTMFPNVDKKFIVKAMLENKNDMFKTIGTLLKLTQS